MNYIFQKDDTQFLPQLSGTAVLPNQSEVEYIICENDIKEFGVKYDVNLKIKDQKFSQHDLIELINFLYALRSHLIEIEETHEDC